jgi:hypothetical protein
MKMLLKRMILMVCVAALAFGIGCSNGADKAGDEAAAAHGAAGAVPGSHEDWCGEHAVAESQCTRCNPALIPAFKATNDWCNEHGLPESQCLKCHPDLKIERPPKPAGT